MAIRRNPPVEHDPTVTKRSPQVLGAGTGAGIQAPPGTGQWGRLGRLGAGIGLSTLLGFGWLLRGQAVEAHHPHDTADVVVAMADGTVFCASDGTLNAFLKSDDGGKTWSESRHGLAGRFIRDLEFSGDWQASGVIYAAPNSGGVQRSTNRGGEWSAPTLFGKFEHLAVDPSSPGGMHLFGATLSAVIRSRDGGTSAEIMLQLSGNRTVRSLSVSPSFDRDSTVVAGVSDGTLEISNNGGRTWARRTLGHTPWAVTLSPRYHLDGRMWVATATGRLALI